MVYLLQNDRQYDYDIRAIALAFFWREKIVEVTEAPAQMRETEDKLLVLQYSDGHIEGILSDGGSRRIAEAVDCDYDDHEHCRNAVCRFFYRLLSRYTGRTLPWGILTGVRPTKIMMQWMETEEDPEVLESRFVRTYLTDRQKSRLCREVAAHEKRLLAGTDFSKEYSLYIGIPFCPTTCLYCSFASFPVSGYANRMEPYLQALFRELSYVAEVCHGRPLTSVYIGGGTPTALTEDCLGRLLDEIWRLFPVSGAREFTVEAGRPDSITPGKLRRMKEAGVTRISINPQTMHQKTLDLIGRAHTVDQTREAFLQARQSGFDNINMDMITGLPGEELSHVQGTLDEIFGLKPESLTVHSLAVKRAAHLNMEMDRYEALLKGSTNEMMRLADTYAHHMGMEPYYMYRQKNIPGNLENIGYSIPGRECFYNMLIMEEKQDIISCGAGATSKYYFPAENRIERVVNVKNLDHYIVRVDEMIDRKRRYHDRGLLCS